ncbi:hypothetical protein [Nostoc sp.]|uniref:hypothetical protein n=1 Tax=Nostoc sp. TaxID=1180 RepID=UPI002FF6EAD1
MRGGWEKVSSQKLAIAAVVVAVLIHRYNNWPPPVATVLLVRRWGLLENSRQLSPSTPSG